MRRKELAKQYYEELRDLQNSKDELPKKLSEKVMNIDKERFIEEYPLSALGVINYRTFWEICLEVGIVHNPFYSDYEKFNTFERKLHAMITSMMYMPTEEKYSNEDIINLFKTYKFIS